MLLRELQKSLLGTRSYYNGILILEEMDAVRIMPVPTEPVVPRSSDMLCLGEDRASRRCRVKNICYEARTDSLFVLKSDESIWTGVPEPDEHGMLRELMDETTQREHNLFYLDLGIKEAGFFQAMQDRLEVRRYIDSITPSIQSAMLSNDRIRLTIVEEPTLLVKRFYPFNVMHILHDDLLGYAEQWKEWGFGDKKDARLVAYDHGHANAHDQIYDWLGPKMQRIHELMGWPNWVGDGQKRREEYVCFRDAVIGTRKAQTWYQYGYFEPQGPLPDLRADGRRIREIAGNVLAHLKQEPWDEAQQRATIKGILSGRATESGDTIIAIFSRKLNRLILNEDELASGLQAAFGLPVVFLRMEEMSLNSIAKCLRRAAIAFGMHGSLLAMAMFMPPGAILIEGYPYGVPPENYTPYRTMCNLPNMQLGYRAWACMDPKAVVGHPERAADKGGIRHLPEAEQKAILDSTTIEPHLCCSNPYWLHRIYQDTRVNVQQVINLIREAAAEIA